MSLDALAPPPIGIADLSAHLRIAVLVPCYNEERTIGEVVAGFRAALPTCTVYVYDNNSRDRTVELARQAGAVVGREPLQGKGNVVRRMFADIEADVYVMVDGDATYDAAAAPELVRTLVAENLDMVNGARIATAQEAYRLGHRFGNVMLTTIVAKIFGDRFKDMLSGYRVFSRRFVKSFPALATGFEIETELTVHALELAMPIAEIATEYGARPADSPSKLSTYKDGFKILMMILRLVKEERPLMFFSVASLGFGLVGLIVGYPVVIEFLQTGLVPRLPSAVLATGLIVLSALSMASGLILDTVTRGRREMKRMRYLSIPAPSHAGRRIEG